MKKSKSLLLWSPFSSRSHQLRCALVFRFHLSLRDIEKLLFERGVTMTNETVRCWCDHAAFKRFFKRARLSA